MSRDYMPHAESDLISWAGRLVRFAEARAEDLQISEAELNALLADHQGFNEAVSDHMAAVKTARGLASKKQELRQSLVDRMRDIAMRIQTSPKCSAGDRGSLGLFTGGPREYVPLDRSDETPVATINISQRMRHTLRISNRTVEGLRRRPENAMGCEIWVKVGDPPSGPDDFRYVTTVTNGRHMVEFTGADAGKKAYYQLRWIGRRSVVGSWSQVFSATIAA